ncbi:MAG: hypothetical protein HYR73_09580 [Candidatus Eisenbacteria bacterium]|nr:hypothetical protein [Candidatus Eisenbacteria bacterium]
MGAVKPGIKSRGLRRPVEVDLGFSWGLNNSLLLGLGVALLLAGYVALSRGSTTLAPVLLVTGYCGFIPASLLIRAKSGGSGE